MLSLQQDILLQWRYALPDARTGEDAGTHRALPDL